MGLFMKKKMLVNFIQKVNNSDIREETLDGHKYVVLPSKTMPANVVMNKLMYSERQIDKTIQSIDGSPAPIDHPMVNGQYVDARETRAALEFGAGVNKLIGKDGDRYSVEKWVNKELLQNTERGKRLQSAIDSGSPIHTSTGVFLSPIPNTAGENEYGEYDAEVEILEFNHDAILPDSIGANTPENGTGIFVNGKSESEEFEVMFVNLTSGDDFSGSSNEVRNKLHKAIKELTNPMDDDSKWSYVEDYNQDTVIYCDGDKLKAVKYLLVDGEIELVGEPKETRVKTVFEFNSNNDAGLSIFHRLAKKLGFSVKSNKSNTNSKEADDMFKETMIQALNGAGIQTEGLDDSKLFAEYNKLIATNAVKSVEIPKQLTAEEIAAIVTNTLAADKAEAAKLAKTGLVDQVIANEKNEYTETDKELLLNTDERILTSMLPAKQAAAISPMHNLSTNGKAMLDADMPE